MLRLIRLIIILWGITFSAFSQKKELFVEYKLNCRPLDGCHKMELYVNNKLSNCNIIRKLNTCEVVNGESIYDTKYYDRYFIKDFESNLLVTQYDIKNVDLYIKEQMDLFKWKPTGRDTTILDYRCQQAQADFRGRTYIAWFTTALPFKAAPWKFHGLPGVVLKINSTDDVFKTEATKLRVENPSGKCIYSHAKKKLISWEEYEKMYKNNSKRNFGIVSAKAAKHDFPINAYAPKLEVLLPINKKLVPKY
jgi:GLPGLI family protein